jgi:hypothetical protein
VAHSFADLGPPPVASNGQNAGACPELYSSWVNQLTFSWMSPLTLIGYRRALNKQDLWTLNDRDLSAQLVSTWQYYWQPKMKKCAFTGAVASAL